MDVAAADSEIDRFLAVFPWLRDEMEKKLNERRLESFEAVREHRRRLRLAVFSGRQYRDLENDQVLVELKRQEMIADSMWNKVLLHICCLGMETRFDLMNSEGEGRGIAGFATGQNGELKHIDMLEELSWRCFACRFIDRNINNFCEQDLTSSASRLLLTFLS